MLYRISSNKFTDYSSAIEDKVPEEQKQQEKYITEIEQLKAFDELQVNEIKIII